MSVRVLDPRLGTSGSVIYSYLLIFYQVPIYVIQLFIYRVKYMYIKNKVGYIVDSFFSELNPEIYVHM